MLIAHIIAVIGLVIATYVDILKREVPDLVSYGTICTGIIIGLATTIIEVSFSPVLSMLFGLLIGAVIGCFMYYAGQWGGGDAKLIMGLGALFGAGSFFYNFLLYLILAGAVYGLLYGFIYSFIHRKAFKKAFVKRARTKAVIRTRFVFQIVVFLALIFGLFVVKEFVTRLAVVVLAAGIYLLFYSWLFAKSLDECMKKKIPVNKLVEGDWVLEEVKVGKKIVVPARYGITKEQIALLKKHKRSVLVKEGIPFVPSFLLAYIATVIAYGFYAINLTGLFSVV